MDKARYKLKQVIENEDIHLVERRKKMAKKLNEKEESLGDTRFGIAMSGGGIRSATINMGFLKVLNHFGILEKADYLSTVSGGGYTGAYVQATLKNKGSYEDLFHEDHIKHLRSQGAYFIPGQTSLEKLWNTLILIVGYFFSLFMSLMGLLVVLFSAIIVLFLAKHLLFPDGFLANEVDGPVLGWQPYEYVLVGLAVVGGVHLFANLVSKFGVGISKVFNKLESVLILGLVLVLIPKFIGLLTDIHLGGGGFLTSIGDKNLFFAIIGMILLGFFLNPNAISFHRFYRHQLAGAFLAFAGKYRNMRLRELVDEDDVSSAPYPLINTCLNLQNPSGDEKFKGAKASDYFLLSPLYCGAKLTDYVSTKHFPGYRDLTLPAATTISAAAVNPGMGIYSNKILSILMTIFNARLGFWVNNPIQKNNRFLVWWPMYFFYELLSKIGTSNRKLNISDGGHIENLAVYELLRRCCRLIIAVDAGADPFFQFIDLENLAIRARNELGIEISFRKGEDPVDVIKPKPSNGYSGKRFAIADLYRLWDEFDLVDSAGNPIKDDDDEALEVLVNYMPRGVWAPEVTLKGKVENNLRRAELIARAEFIMEQNLKSKSHLNGKEKVKFGTMVYVKSSVTAPTRKQNLPRGSKDKDKGLGVFQKLSLSLKSMFSGEQLKKDSYKYDTYKYKIYHPAFPHEPTSDQFFDPVQWESYFQLGQFVASDVLELDSEVFNLMLAGGASAKQKSISDLIDKFDRITKHQESVPGRPQKASEKPEEAPVVITEKADSITLEESGIDYRM